MCEADRRSRSPASPRPSSRCWSGGSSRSPPPIAPNADFHRRTRCGRQAGRLWLNAVGVTPRIPRSREGAHRFATQHVEQPAHALVAEVFAGRRSRVQRVLDVVPVDRRADADAGIEAPAGQDVYGRQVLGQPKRSSPSPAAYGVPKPIASCAARRRPGSRPVRRCRTGSAGGVPRRCRTPVVRRAR